MDYIVKNKIQEFAKKNDLMVGSDFYGALDKEIERLLKVAAKRCTENKRKTLKSYDL